MNDETDKTAETAATQQRGRPREAPTIEGQAIESETVAPKADPAPAFAWPGPAALAALLMGAVALYYALNPTLPPAAAPETVSALGQRLESLEARLGALESKPAPALPAPPDLGPLTARLDATEKAAADARAQAARAVEQARTPPAPPPRVDLGPLEQRLSRLETRLDSDLAPLRAALAAPKTDVRATQAPDVAGVAPQDAAALAVIAGSLRQQIERGAPFAREAGALQKLGADPARLARLTPLATTGAPSAARLAQDFAAVSSAMLRAARPVRTDGDLMDRLARSAASLVRIRPAGESAGEDGPALVSRIEGALQRGEIAEALAMFDRLPDEMKAPARDWATRARARVEADAAARSLLDDALDTLARK